MCGRFTLSKPRGYLLEQLQAEDRTERELNPDYNIAPTKQVYATVTPEEDEPRQLLVMRCACHPRSGRRGSTRPSQAVRCCTYSDHWAKASAPTR